MKSIEIKIKTINPIIIAENSGDRNMLISKDYIPGSSLLGIFAGKYIRENKIGINAHTNEVFSSWFLKGDIIFADSFIFDKKRYYPTPLSVRREKHDENQIHDLFFVEPDKQTKTMSSFSNKTENAISKIEVKKEISFHHARNWDTGSSQKGVIFNYEHIKENQIFVGNIIGKDENIADFYKHFSKMFIARVGKSKNSQYGKVEIKLSEPKVYEQGLETDIESDSEIVMTCLSDAIIYNENGFSTTNICDISKELGVKKIGKAFLKKSRNEQFVGIWKLKKQSENVISAGSCFLLKELPENYDELQKIGFGERTNEGFGRVIFGYQNADKINYFDDKKNDKPSTPKTEISEFLTKLIIDIVIEKLFENEKKEALMNSYEFMNTERKIIKLPSKSLLGKLQIMTRDIKEFESNLKKVVNNKPAEQQLKKANNGKITLLDFITKKGELENSINIPADIEYLLNEINISLELDEEHKAQLNQRFLETFFNSLRKREVKK